MKVGQVVFGLFSRIKAPYELARYEYRTHYLTKEMAKQEAEVLRDDGHSISVQAVIIRSL